MEEGALPVCSMDQSLVLGLSAPLRHLASLLGSAPALPLHRRAAAPAPPASLGSAHHPSWRWVRCWELPDLGTVSRAHRDLARCGPMK